VLCVGGGGGNLDRGRTILTVSGTLAASGFVHSIDSRASLAGPSIPSSKRA